MNELKRVMWTTNRPVVLFIKKLIKILIMINVLFFGINGENFNFIILLIE